MISLSHLNKSFGGIHAVNDASLKIETGSITGLIGPNGAGKTTLFNIITGLYKPDSGTVMLDGRDITDLPPHELFHRGLLRTFQIAHEFSTLTVRDNLKMVVANQSGEHLLAAWFRSKKVLAEEEHRALAATRRHRLGPRQCSSSRPVLLQAVLT